MKRIDYNTAGAYLTMFVLVVLLIAATITAPLAIAAFVVGATVFFGTPALVMWTWNAIAAAVNKDKT